MPSKKTMKPQQNKSSTIVDDLPQKSITVKVHITAEVTEMETILYPFAGFRKKEKETPQKPQSLSRQPPSPPPSPSLPAPPCRPPPPSSRPTILFPPPSGDIFLPFQEPFSSGGEAERRLPPSPGIEQTPAIRLYSKS